MDRTQNTLSVTQSPPAFHAQLSKNQGFNQTQQFGRFVRTVSTPEKAEKSGLLHKAEHTQQPTEISYFNRLQTIIINVTCPLTLRNKCFFFFLCGKTVFKDRYVLKLISHSKRIVNDFF